MTYEELQEEWNNKTTTMCCHTSGSTGIPSEILLPKERMRESAIRTCRFFNITTESHLHSCISPDFIGGKMMWVRANEKGCKFSYEQPSNNILTDYLDTPLDLVAVVPSQMIKLISSSSALPKVRNYLVGGAPLPDSLRHSIVDKGLSCWESYGMTETSSHIALREVTLEETPFKTLDGITVSLTKENCLCISIPNWKTIETNDLAEVITPRLFYITGRIDNVINSGGKKINPEILEKKLSSVFDFKFAISSIPDPLWGEKVVIALENPLMSDDEIIKRCSQILSRFEIPKQVIRLLAPLPHTANGKINRKVLKQRLLTIDFDLRLHSPKDVKMQGRLF